MKTKLTLTIKKEIVEKAKRRAAGQGISLSKLIEGIFEKEDPELEKTPEQLAAARFLERLKNETPIKALDKSDKELIREHRDKKTNLSASICIQGKEYQHSHFCIISGYPNLYAFQSHGSFSGSLPYSQRVLEFDHDFGCVTLVLNVILQYLTKALEVILDTLSR